ncbi:MAG: hypothetical protein ACOC0U_03090 [Desulfovibrionales bacterium]
MPQEKSPIQDKQKGIHRESPLEIILLGLQTVFSEWKWLGIKSLRTMELRQLNKRLDQEYLTLGRLQFAEEKTSTIKEEIALCEKQISFLEEEIETLENELDKTRQDYIAKRIEHWNLPDQA